MSAHLTAALLGATLGALTGLWAATLLARRNRDLQMAGDVRPVPCTAALVHAWWPLLVACAAAGVAVALWSGPDPLRWVWWPLALLAGPLAIADVTWRLLPTSLLTPAAVATFTLVCTAAVHEHDPAIAVRAAAGGAAAWVVFTALSLSGQLGGGDVRLAAALATAAAAHSWAAAAVMLVAAFAVGAMLATVMLALRRGRGVPFGPALLVGAAVGAVAGSRVADGYLLWVLGS